MRLTIIAACIMFALGALAGRMTVTPASATMADIAVSPMEMMQTAYGLPVESHTAI